MVMPVQTAPRPQMQGDSQTQENMMLAMMMQYLMQQEKFGVDREIAAGNWQNSLDQIKAQGENQLASQKLAHQNAMAQDAYRNKLLMELNGEMFNQRMLEKSVEWATSPHSNNPLMAIHGAMSGGMTPNGVMGPTPPSGLDIFNMYGEQEASKFLAKLQGDRDAVTASLALTKQGEAAERIAEGGYQLHMTAQREKELVQQSMKAGHTRADTWVRNFKDPALISSSFDKIEKAIATGSFENFESGFRMLVDTGNPDTNSIAARVTWNGIVSKYPEIDPTWSIEDHLLEMNQIADKVGPHVMLQVREGLDSFANHLGGANLSFNVDPKTGELKGATSEVKSLSGKSEADTGQGGLAIPEFLAALQNHPKFQDDLGNQSGPRDPQALASLFSANEFIEGKPPVAREKTTTVEPMLNRHSLQLVLTDAMVTGTSTIYGLKGGSHDRMIGSYNESLNKMWNNLKPGEVISAEGVQETVYPLMTGLGMAETILNSEEGKAVAAAFPGGEAGFTNWVHGQVPTWDILLQEGRNQYEADFLENELPGIMSQRKAKLHNWMQNQHVARTAAKMEVLQQAFNVNDKISKRAGTALEAVIKANSQTVPANLLVPIHETLEAAKMKINKQEQEEYARKNAFDHFTQQARKNAQLEQKMKDIRQSGGYMAPGLAPPAGAPASTPSTPTTPTTPTTGQGGQSTPGPQAMGPGMPGMPNPYQQATQQMMPGVPLQPNQIPGGIA